MKEPLQSLFPVGKNSIYYYLLLFLIFIGSCDLINKRTEKVEDKGKVLAKVHDTYLYDSDLAGVITRPLSKEDSQRIINDFVTRWVGEQLVFNKALRNLSKDEKDKNKELEDYYRALVTYAYESKVVEQRLNKELSDEEIEEYYQNNKDVFTLNKCILRTIFLKIPFNAPDQRELKKWFMSDKDIDYDRLLQYCMGNAVLFNLDNQKWFNMDEINAIMPLNMSCDNVLNKSMLEFTDSVYVYYLKIESIRPRGSISPLEFVRENIVNAILHRRRLSLINAVYKQIFDEGKSKNYFEIYE